MLKYALLWLPMVLIAIANGAVRELTYGQYVSELAAHQLSTAIGICLLAVYIWWVIRLLPPRSSAQAMSIGLVWLALTVAFEFIFGHYFTGHSWGRLFQDYNLLAGRLWALVPAWVAVAPVLFYRLSGRPG